MHNNSENRSHYRVRCFAEGKLYTNKLGPFISRCIVRQISNGDALITMDPNVELPETFVLSVDKFGIVTTAQSVREVGDAIAIRFLEKSTRDVLANFPLRLSPAGETPVHAAFAPPGRPQRRSIWAVALGVAALGALLMIPGPARADPADAAHVALREAATWTACIERRILDPELDADLVDLSAVSHIDSHFLRQTGRRAFDWTPLDAASYRQLGFALLEGAQADQRGRFCAAAKLWTLHFLREPSLRPTPNGKSA